MSTAAGTGVCVRAYEPLAAISLIENALEGTAEALGDEHKYVAVGDTIPTNDLDVFLVGHGTRLVDGSLKATLCGVVERVNQLILVRPLKNRYKAQPGDVVVGRVTEIAGKRWKLDLNSHQEAGLLLSAVNLPGGVQRRRNAEDELNMRSLFREGDLVSAEVQAVNADGGIALHTRSDKYGKLSGGQLLVVPPNLVKRQKQHFVALQAIGVDLILGVNGLLWVAPHAASQDMDVDGEGGGGGAAAAARQRQRQQPSFSRQQLEAATRAANVIRALAKLYLTISAVTITDAYEVALEQAVPLDAMLEGELLTALVRSEAVRRHGGG